MSDALIPVKPLWEEHALIKRADYEAMYARSIEDPEAFWADQVGRINRI